MGSEAHQDAGILATDHYGESLYTWAHATSPAGLLGFLKLGVILPSCQDIIEYDRAPVGFFTAGSQDPSTNAILKMIIQRSQSAKNSGSFVVTGQLVTCHQSVQQGETFNAQRTCETALLTHRPRDKKWYVHFRYCHAQSLWFAQAPPQDHTPIIPPHNQKHLHQATPPTSYLHLPDPLSWHNIQTSQTIIHQSTAVLVYLEIFNTIVYLETLSILQCTAGSEPFCADYDACTVDLSSTAEKSAPGTTDCGHTLSNTHDLTVFANNIYSFYIHTCHTL